MLLLYICNEYTDDLIGGIGTVVKTEAQAMVKLGHKAYVVGTYLDTPTPPTPREEVDGITIIRWNDNDYNTFLLSVLKSLSIWCATWHLRRVAKKLVKARCKQIFMRTAKLVNDLVRQEHIDLIELPDYYDDFYRYPFIVPKKPFVVPTIIRVHGSVSFIQHYAHGNVSPRILAADRSLFAQADGISAVSEFSKRFVQEHLCTTNQNVDVIYNPLENRLFDNTKECRNNQTILFIGKINEAKGAYSIIKAFNKLAQKYPHVVLRLIGEGDIPYAQSMVASHCADRVLFTGYLLRDKVIDEIDAATFCVLPSYFENFSMAALEVLARKRALIYTNRASGIELIQDGVDGMLADPDNIDKMVEKISLLLDNVSLRDEMAEKGYRMCRERYAADVIIPQIEHYYRLCAE